MFYRDEGLEKSEYIGAVRRYERLGQRVLKKYECFARNIYLVLAPSPFVRAQNTKTKKRPTGRFFVSIVLRLFLLLSSWLSLCYFLLCSFFCCHKFFVWLWSCNVLDLPKVYRVIFFCIQKQHKAVYKCAYLLFYHSIE